MPSAYAEADLRRGDRYRRRRVPAVGQRRSFATISNWPISAISTDGPTKIDIGSPQVVLEQVTLDVGSLFDSFLGDTFSTIYDIVKPMKPVVDLLLMDIDLGVLKVQFIDIAYLRLPAKVVDTAKKVLEVLKVHHRVPGKGQRAVGGRRDQLWRLQSDGTELWKIPTRQPVETDVAGASAIEWPVSPSRRIC